MSSARERSRTPAPSQQGQASGLVFGTVKKISGGNAFCSVEGFEKDVLLGSRSLTEAGLSLATVQIGDGLMFEVEEGLKGYHAINIQRAPKRHSKGQHTSQHLQASHLVVGTVKKIHGSNAFCSVEGIEKDILLGSRSLSEAGLSMATLQVGDRLMFEVEESLKGYHAINIQQPGNARYSKGHHVAMVPYAQHYQASPLVVGTVKRIHGGNAFCSVQGIGQDILLGSRSLSEAGLSLSSLQVGDSLMFAVEEGPKGYHAVNIQQAAPRFGPKGYSKGYYAPMVQYVQQPSRHNGSQRVVGTVKRIHGGNAFCSVEGFPKDVLVGSRSLSEAGLDLAEMQEGDSLTFEVQAGSKGYHALNIQKDDVGKRVIGTLKKIHGGNAFCSVDGVEKDVLLGARSLSDSGVHLESLQLGDVLSFELARGPKGYNAIDILRESA